MQVIGGNMKKLRYRILVKEHIKGNGAVRQKYYAGKDYGHTYKKEFRQQGWHTYHDNGIKHDRWKLTSDVDKAQLLTSRELKTFVETMDRVAKYELEQFDTLIVELVEVD